MKIQAIIFDMDGVLVDTEPLFRKKVYDFYHRYEKDVPLQELSQLAGSSHQKAMELMRDWFGEDMCVEAFASFYFKHTKPLEFSYQDLIHPYVRYILPRLKQQGIRLAIASSSPQKDIEKCISDCELSSYFDFIVSGRDFQESKPNPEIYEYTVSKLGVKKEHCIVIEDSTYGIAAGKHAGLTVYAFHDERFGFDQTKADWIFYDFLELYQCILEGGI